MELHTRRLAIEHLKIIFQQYMAKYDFDSIRRKKSTGTSMFAMSKGCMDVAGARKGGEFGLLGIVAHVEKAVGVKGVAMAVDCVVVPHEYVWENDLGALWDDGAV
jgi:hypothetical protein